MLDYSLAVDRPSWLLLLLLLPVLWAWSFKSLSGLGSGRRYVALALRTAVCAALIGALAEVQFRQNRDQLTVLYLLDQSLSIPAESRDAMVRYVNASVREHRRDDKGDRVGVIVFGREAKVELPPVDFDYEMGQIETDLNEEYTNLETALQRAMSLFPHDAAKRVVVITDGNENVGDALRQARAMAASGVSIDVLPAPITPRSEVSVDKVAVPAEARRGQPFELRVVLNHRPLAGAGEGEPVAGALRIVRKYTDAEGNSRETLISDAPIELSPGKRVFTVTETIDEPSSYTYEARFIPVNTATDGSARNNVASGFSYVRGKGQVLLIEDFEHPGEFRRLVQRLRAEGLQVVVQPSNRLFASLAELQRFDSVILANVPRSSGFGGMGDGMVDANRLDGFDDDQIRMLVRNTEELGCGLIMLGGDRSFGAGDWTDSELEKALPVDFRIKAAKVTPVGALALVLDRSGSMAGEKLRIARAAAAAAVQVLGPRDYASVVTFDNEPEDVVPMRPVGDRAFFLSRIQKIGSGGGTNLYPAMRLGFEQFSRAGDASVRHMIVLTDGLTPNDNLLSLVSEMRRQGVTVTTVSIGQDSDSQLLSRIAHQGGGKFYLVRSPNMTPRIFQREARRVAQPVVRELAPPESPLVNGHHEILTGIPGNPPPLSGFVQTTVKDSPLVDVVLQSPTPPNEENATVLATWTYGLGKTAAFTADAGHRWAGDWTGWEHYDRFFSQLVRWSMRPTGDSSGFLVATETQDGNTRVIVDALDKDDEFINARAMTGSAVTPRLESKPLLFEQTAPGRYVANFESSDAGSYLLSVNPGGGQAIIRTGVNVGYSDEFRAHQANRPLLKSIAQLTPHQGKPGKVIDEEAKVELPTLGAIPKPLLAIDPYRRDLPQAVASQEIWPLLVLFGSCLFFADVLVRRVQVGLEWLEPMRQWLTARGSRRNDDANQPATINRLQSRKAEVRKQTTRQGKLHDAEASVETSNSPRTTRPQMSPQSPSGQRDASANPLTEASYTERLLEAKKLLRHDGGKK